MPLRLPDEYVDKVDVAKWEKPFNINNEEDHTAKIVNEYILNRLTWYKSQKTDNYRLWD
jgi:hypothetical protein